MSERLLQEPPIPVVLLGLDLGQYDMERSMDELAALCEANGMKMVAQVVQKRSAPEAGTMLGEGKLEEARQICESLEA